MLSFSIIYFLHTIWAFLKGVNYSYATTQDFINNLILGICINLLIGFSLRGLIKNRKIRASFFFVFIFVLVMALRYRYRSLASIDMAVVFDNFDLALNSNGASVVFSKFKAKDFFISGIVALIFSIVELKSKKTIKRHFRYSVISLLAYLSFVNYNVVYSDELSKLFSSSLNYFKSNSFDNQKYKEHLETGSRKTNVSSLFKSRPDIYVILLESFNGQYLNKLTDDGKEVTPVMNKLYKKYSGIKNYYSPTVQTIRAQYSVLCSKVPRLRGKVSYALDKYKFNCLPKLMRGMGYQTFFYQSFKDMSFDNTQEFAEKIGFEFIESPDLSKLDQEIKSEGIWGWGLQDNLSYRLFLDRSAGLGQENNKPMFSMMSTISHHVGFDIPSRLNKLHKSPKGRKEKFENSLHLSDSYLKGILDIIEERKLTDNSVFIITADHSFPNGEHGNFSNELGAFEENFKVPFVIISNEKFKPMINQNLTYSHYDILPTVLEVAGAKGRFEAVGESLYTKSENTVSPLVQPYDGGRFVFVNYPMKRTFVRATNKYYETILGTGGKEKPVSKNIDDYTGDALSFMFAELELVKKEVK